MSIDSNVTEFILSQFPSAERADFEMHFDRLCSNSNPTDSQRQILRGICSQFYAYGLLMGADSLQ